MSQDQPRGSEPQAPAPEPDPVRQQLALERLKSEQNLPAGLLAGLIGSLVGAAAWALVTAFTRLQIGWMAIGVGFLVGSALRSYGKGLDRVFGVAGALLALLGCALGNLLAVCIMVAEREKIPLATVLAGLDLDAILNLMSATFSPMDLLFYGIALYEGYRLSFRRVSQEDLAKVLAI
ncbi:MAG TPA: hypothetical protein VFT43_11080 [Candidatus Polarisedimenticolia bacterium]|nr:hypothetical protein [Candidatus Polarisedimenticolia bacterium]